MRKISKFSLVAMLAVSPMIALAADPIAPSSNLTGNNAGKASNGEYVIFAGEPYYPGKTISDTDKTTAASAAYVKGAYNDAISAANEVALKTNLVGDALTNIQTYVFPTFANTGLSNLSSTGKANVSAQGTVDLTKNDYGTGTVGKALVDIKTATDGAVQGVKVNNTALTEDSGGDVNITIAEGTTDGTVKVNNSDVAVHNVATKAGVTSTITNSTASGTFDMVTDWVNETVDQVTVSSTISGANYTTGG